MQQDVPNVQADQAETFQGALHVASAYLLAEERACHRAVFQLQREGMEMVAYPSVGDLQAYSAAEMGACC